METNNFRQNLVNTQRCSVTLNSLIIHEEITILCMYPVPFLRNFHWGGGAKQEKKAERKI